MRYAILLALVGMTLSGCVSYRWKLLAIEQSKEIEKANEAMEKALPMIEQCIRVKKNCGRMKF